MFILIEHLQINHVKSGWSWEVSQVLPFVVLPNMSHFSKRNIMLLLIPFGRGEWIPENILCKLYMLKIWEWCETC